MMHIYLIIKVESKTINITDVVALDFLIVHERFSGKMEDALILRICKIFQLVMMFKIAIRNSSVR
ncbi:hypothetical protein T11_3071 [Trichinella zimbabwensis]|uniref:Uncharacterized protein n=1 Tax=Trichinella zimbabwensis TaxID=268475 RepID=A0A0V1I318_9BILA|nr:hypothetical protein T11_3071 [Trichinella zimbabwensis]